MDTSDNEDEEGGDEDEDDVIIIIMRMNWQDSTSPGFLWVFGTRQRTKWGSQL